MARSWPHGVGKIWVFRPQTGSPGLRAKRLSSPRAAGSQAMHFTVDWCFSSDFKAMRPKSQIQTTPGHPDKGSIESLLIATQEPRLRGGKKAPDRYGGFGINDTIPKRNQKIVII